jgi:cytochrome c-type biogenesis protein CcmH
MMRICTSLALALFLLITMGHISAYAVLPDEILPDAELEQRARALSSELRCMVCQNQSIDDSMAPLARDLRLLVRERLNAGDSDEQVRLFLVARYGDFILLNPPFKIETLLLWLSPLFIFILGFIIIASKIAGKSNDPPFDQLLNKSEQDTLNAILMRDENLPKQ